MTDFESTSRFAADQEFKVVTRKGTTIGTVTLMPTPTRGPNDSIHIVTLKNQYRWDLIAEELLGDAGLKWVLMRHNRIEDPFAGPQPGDRLLIPTAEQVQYYRQQTG
jgi:hypothetical protein